MTMIKHEGRGRRDENHRAGDRGSIFFIKLEPWSWRGHPAPAFPLADIAAGKFDEGLKRFAEGARACGKPFFLSFGHEMNGNWYPWAGDPEQYVAAYRHVHQKFAEYGMTNATWIWNPNIEPADYFAYYPGDAYVDWVGIDGYNTEDYGLPWRTPEEIFGGPVRALRALGKPLMIAETGCDVNSDLDRRLRKPEFLEQLFTLTVDHKLQGILYFNVNVFENGRPKNWKIDDDISRSAVRRVLAEKVFNVKRTIQLEEEVLP